jgi:hypothetical protein
VARDRHDSGVQLRHEIACGAHAGQQPRFLKGYSPFETGLRLCLSPSRWPGDSLTARAEVASVDAVDGQFVARLDI